MKLLSLLLSLLLTLPAPLRLTLTAERSETMSAGAVSALNALLRETALTFSADAFVLEYAGDAVLTARLGEGIACGESAAPLARAESGHAGAMQAAQALGALLSPWEQQSEQAVDLQEAGSARTVYAYVLTGEEWESVWPEAVDILAACLPEAEALRGAQIVGKGTFKRYFDRGMNEIGAYFYAQEAHLGEEKREVRLEYAASGSGFFIAFRCPDAKQTRNLRVSLHGRARGGAYTLSGDVRHTMDKGSDVWTVSGKTDGALNLAYTRRRNGAAAEYALSLTLREGGADYTLTRSQRLMLGGAAAWQAADAPGFTLPACNTDTNGVAAALAKRLIAALREKAPEDWQQLLHAAGTAVLLGQKNDIGETE